MALKGERTDMTFDEQGRITRLDSIFPELERGEVVIGVDLYTFSLSHPLRGLWQVQQLVYDGEDTGFTSENITRVSAEVNFEAGMTYEDVRESQDRLIIVQHIGMLGMNSYAVGASTYELETAETDASVLLENMTGASDKTVVLEDYASRVN